MMEVSGLRPRSLFTRPPAARAPAKATLSVLGYCFLVAVGTLVGLMAGGALTSALGLPSPSLPAGAEASQLIGLKFAGAFGVSALLFLVARRLPVPFVERASILFLAIWGIQGPITIAEAAFFTTYGGTAAQLIITAASAIAQALLLAALFPPPLVDRTLLGSLRALPSIRPVTSWLWRFILAGALYLPAYWFFGLLAYGFTQPYYEDPALGTGLRVPPAEQIIPLEIARGLGFVLILFPVLTVLRRPRWQLVGWLGLVIALLAGWEPLVTAPFLPPFVRLVHAAEITADAFVQAFTMVLLFGAALAGAQHPAETQRGIHRDASP